MFSQNLIITMHEKITPDKLKAAREERKKLTDAMHGLADEQRNAEFHVGWLRDQAAWYRKDAGRSIDVCYRNRAQGIAQGYQQAAEDIERMNKRRVSHLCSLSEVLDL